ncbi:MAG: hypothetical protein NTX36_05455 [Proteobacteria bacterium]|nr:hypothetical protein [Pseudomonadota bacterium]
MYKKWRAVEPGEFRSFSCKIKAAGIIVDEKPDVPSFRIKASQMKENKIFRGKDVRVLLQKFLKATASDEPRP